MVSQRQLIKFLERNELKIKIVKNDDYGGETGYTYQIYILDHKNGDYKCIHDMNEFYISNSVFCDPLKSDVLEFISFRRSNEDIINMCLGTEGTYPLADIKGIDFKFNIEDVGGFINEER